GNSADEIRVAGHKAARVFMDEAA
ncbi:MAG: hypothetical protein RLZZ326_3814, partial [Planctomycetota bacterium]